MAGYGSTTPPPPSDKDCAKVPIIKEKKDLNWTGPFKIVAVGPSPTDNQPDGRPLGDKLLYLDLPSSLSGPAAKPRVTVARCKPCTNPYNADDMPRHLPAGLIQYILHAFAIKSSPYHVTTDDVATPPILIDVTKITSALIRFKASYMASLAKNSYIRTRDCYVYAKAYIYMSTSRFLIFTPGTITSTPRIAISTPRALFTYDEALHQRTKILCTQQ